MFLSQFLDTTNFKSEENISLFCSILKQKENEYSEQADNKMKMIASIIFDILKIISKTQIFSEHLTNSLEFVKLITRAFSTGDREFFVPDDLKKLVNILQNILTNENIETESFLIKDGLVMFLLHVIFDKSFNGQMRYDVGKLIKIKIDEVGSVVRAFMPIHFFKMGEYAKQKIMSDEEMIELLIQSLDDYQYDN